MITEILLNPITEKKNVYRFTTATTDFSKGKNNVQVQCIKEIEISFCGKIKEHFVFNIFTSNVQFKSNKAIPNEALLKKDIYAFDGIHLVIDSTGEIVGILNLAEMQNRWEKTKFELRHDYSGYEFEDWLSDTTEILADEEKTIYYLKTPAMFSLFFHGLFGDNTIDKMPIRRKKTLLDFDDTEITEEISIDKKEPVFRIKAQKNEADEIIISDNNSIKGYEGILRYDVENQLLEGNLNVESEKININYNIVWVG